jgi:hypothetical protein
LYHLSWRDPVRPDYPLLDRVGSGGGSWIHFLVEQECRHCYLKRYKKVWLAREMKIFTFGVVLTVATILLWPTGNLAASQASAPGEGFEPLFNGVNLVGWMVTNGHARDWSVGEGEMVVNGRSAGAAGELRTAKKYGSFELRLEFMVSEGGNSGVFFRMGEDDMGLEVQLLDDYSPNHANLYDWQYTGALYGMAAPARRASRSAGEWQEMTIRLQGQGLSVTLNGNRIVETDLARFVSDEAAADWQEPLRRSSGYLGLQNYGNETRFRNLRIRTLD